MTSIPALFHLVSSGVCKITAKIGENVSSGTGFVVQNKIVTCAHVYRQLPDCASVKIAFHDGHSIDLPQGCIAGSVVGISDEQAHDFCVLDLGIDFSRRHNFKFSGDEIEVGTQVCAFGYPFGRNQLSVHSGIVSARFQSGVADMLQLDMSINNANSGGPLVDLQGNLVGIICRKATGLTDMFNELRNSFKANQRLLQNALNSSGSVTINGISPIELGLAIQMQMERVAIELERSSNVGIGYAIGCQQLSDEQCFTQ